MREMTRTMETLCLKANRKMEPSSPTMLVAAVATAMDWGEIIFPHTPPEELDATIRVVLTPICSAALPILKEISWEDQPARRVFPASENYIVMVNGNTK